MLLHFYLELQRFKNLFLQILKSSFSFPPFNMEESFATNFLLPNILLNLLRMSAQVAFILSADTTKLESMINLRLS